MSETYESAQVALQHEQCIELLRHFSASKDLPARLETAQATLPFCELALALHEMGLDWWITEAGGIHAGRSEDFRVLRVDVSLRVEVGADFARVTLHGSGEAQWQTLKEVLIDSLVDSVSRAAATLPRTMRPGYWPDDYGNMDDRLVITLSDGALRNGYLSVPKLQRLFPEDCLGESDQPAKQLFNLRLPDGQIQQTQVLKQNKRVQARFNALFARQQLQAGDQAVITRIADFDYQLSFRCAGEQGEPAVTKAEHTDTEAPMNESPLNQILFGPPGTGKTYATVDAALEVLDPGYLGEQLHNRSALKRRFDELVQQERIRFVTFHQSFSYEDFVEGLRATTEEDTGQLRYEVVDGVFKALCDAASAKVTQQAEAPSDLDKRRVWKMSLGNTLGDDASIYQECLAGDYVLLGYGAGIDFAGCTDRKTVQERFAQKGVQPENPSIDYGITSVTTFVCKMQKGDLIVVSDGNFKFRAIGEVTGDYQFKQHADFENAYAQMRTVKWLRQYEPSLPHSELLNAQFSQMTLYQLRPPTLDREKLKGLLDAAGPESGTVFQVGQRFGQGYVVRSVGAEVVEFDKPRGGVLPLPLSIIKQLLAYTQAGQINADDIRQGRVFEKVAEADLEKYIVNGYQSLLASLVEQLLLPADRPHTNDARVLIIDEINRGNVSRIFGELITLIEPSKRAGADEALSVVLPYSKQRFSVPSNVHLIGTMNTADRSLAGLDIALRRRFTFTEMPPKPELLDGVNVEGVNVGQLLRVMNQRIEVLLDRDHCLGHAYFMSLKDGDSLDNLEGIFRNQLLPLLQEYFFEDWQRIQWILNDHRKAAQDQFVRKPVRTADDLFGTGADVPQHDMPWQLNDDAFNRVEAYLGIIDHQAKPSALTSVQEATDQPYKVRLLSSGSIEVLHEEQLVSPVKPILRKLADKLSVPTHGSTGTELNTRSLGRKVIDAIQKSAQ